MHVFVAGASGAIGLPLIAELIAQGHSVTGMTHSEAGALPPRAAWCVRRGSERFRCLGFEPRLATVQAEVVIDELTSLPKDPSQIAAASAADRKLRIEGGGNLHRACASLRRPSLHPAVERVLPEMCRRSGRRNGRAGDRCESRRRRQCQIVYRVGAARFELGKNGRNLAPPLRFLLRPEHLVLARRRGRRQGSFAKSADRGTGRGHLVVGAYRGRRACDRGSTGRSARNLQHRG